MNFSSQRLRQTRRALYLTLNTMDGRLFTECLQGGVDSWGNFVLKTVAANQIPQQFPLRIAPYGLASGLFSPTGNAGKPSK